MQHNHNDKIDLIARQGIRILLIIILLIILIVLNELGVLYWLSSIQPTREILENIILNRIPEIVYVDPPGFGNVECSIVNKEYIFLGMKYKEYCRLIGIGLIIGLLFRERQLLYDIYTLVYYFFFGL